MLLAVGQRHAILRIPLPGLPMLLAVDRAKQSGPSPIRFHETEKSAEADIYKLFEGGCTLRGG